MNKKITAGILAMIIILLTPAYAQQLEITQYSGADEINGWAKSNDQIIIKATAEIYGNPTKEIAARRLKATHSGITKNFDQCSTYGANQYQCTYTTQGAYSGDQTFIIELTDAEENIIETQQKTISTDNLAPEITYFDVNPKRSKTTKATLEYTAEDYASSTGDTTKCSGLKEIQFLVNNAKAAADTGAKQECTKTNTIEYTRQVNEYEQITICAKAIDYLEQQSAPYCIEYEIDRQAPQIQEIHVKDPDGFDMTAIQPETTITASIEAVITGNNNDIQTIKADLSSLNPGITGQKEPDEQYADTYIWRDIQITNPSNCEITITAADDLGNTATSTQTCTLPTDDTGPEIVQIQTNKTSEAGTYLMGNNGTITAEIREPGAGLHKKHVYMDISNIGRAYSTQQRADSCTIKTGDVWECKWKIQPKVPNGKYTVRINPNTRDDLDNPLQNAMEQTIQVDRTQPSIENVEYKVMHAFAEYGDLTVKGDTIEFKIQTKGTEYAYSDFTGIGGSHAPGTCTGTDLITCEFSQIIQKSGPDNATITFELYDRAGNKRSYTHDLVIYGIAEDSSPEYWNSTIECSPKLIDRSTTTQQEQMVYCHIKLHTTNEEAEPVYTSVNFNECTGYKQGIAKLQMMNNGMGSTDPYMRIKLALSEFKINNMSFSCPVHISTKIGEYFSKTDEEEDVDINLEFYDLPIGELYENIEKDIEHHMEFAMKNQAWIDDVEEYMEWARTICGWKNKFSGILSALDATVSALVPILAALELAGESETAKELGDVRVQACQNVRGPMEQWLFGKTEKDKGELGKEIKILWQVLEMMCDFVNCKLTWDDEKYQALKEEGALGEYGEAGGGFLVAIGGGGVPEICQGAENLLGGNLGMGTHAYSEYQKLQSKLQQTDEPKQRLVNVEESIVWSTACTCLPGIIHNLHKIRQINCKYALCLAEEVSAQGIDPAWCRAEKSYLTCTYVMGEIFSILPLAAIYDKTINTLKEWYTNPITLIGAVSGCLCGGCPGGLDLFCDEDSELSPAAQAGAYLVCIAPKTASKIMDAVASYESLRTASKGFEIGTGYCTQAEQNEVINDILE